MPHKFNQTRRHKFEKAKYRVFLVAIPTVVEQRSKSRIVLPGEGVAP